MFVHKKKKKRTGTRLVIFFPTFIDVLEKATEKKKKSCFSNKTKNNVIARPTWHVAQHPAL